MPATVYLAQCTCPDLEVAEQLAESLVQEGLAACVNLVPGLTSVYRWEGAVARDTEVLLLIKTTEECLAAVAAHIEREHPYDLPELIAYPIVAGLPTYLDWVRTCATRRV